MSIPDAAIEAAAEALLTRNGHRWGTSKRWDNFYRDHARAAIEAAMPTIREAIAQEIEVYDDAAPYDGWHEMKRDAIYIVRGGAA